MVKLWIDHAAAVWLGLALVISHPDQLVARFSSARVLKGNDGGHFKNIQLERLVSEMTYYVSSGTLNSTNSTL